MCKIFIISLLSLFINSFATAQSVVPSVIMGRDTVPHVLLHEVDVVARLKNPRKYARQQQRNQRMVYNVRKVFPYAKIAAAKINEIENKLAQTDSEAKRNLRGNLRFSCGKRGNYRDHQKRTPESSSHVHGKYIPNMGYSPLVTGYYHGKQGTKTQDASHGKLPGVRL